MGYADVNMTVLKKLKSKDLISIKCDNCKVEFSRPVKRVRGAIKSGIKQSFCNIKCQIDYYTKISTCSCKQCNKDFVQKLKEQKFCSNSCSNTYTNLNRKHSNNTKKKISNSIKNKFGYKKPSKRMYINCNEEFSTIYTCKCKHCKFVGSYRKQFKYCKECRDMYYTARNRYIFTFDIYKYPDLFDLSLIKLHGLYNSKKGNLSGLSKDHKVSVNDSIKYNYDPYYIKHPINCDLISMKDNLSKFSRSSITYEDLVKLVDEYDKKSN